MHAFQTALDDSEGLERPIVKKVILDASSLAGWTRTTLGSTKNRKLLYLLRYWVGGECRRLSDGAKFELNRR